MTTCLTLSVDEVHYFEAFWAELAPVDRIGWISRNPYDTTIVPNHKLQAAFNTTIVAHSFYSVCHVNSPYTFSWQKCYSKKTIVAVSRI